MINTDPNHVHTYDANGNMTCCTLEDKINRKADQHPKHHHKHDGEHNHDEEHDHGHEHDPEGGSSVWWKSPDMIRAVISIILLVTGIVLDNTIAARFVNPFRIIFYGVAFIPVAYPVIIDAFKSIAKGEVFNEFFLMGIATIGAFYVGQYPEGVTVMLFYAIGEIFQTIAVRRAKANIKSLLDQRPDEVTVIKNNQEQKKKAETVELGEIIQLKPGEKLALDGELISDSATFNTAALTGESKPDSKKKGEIVLAGMINLNTVALVKVTTAFQDSKLSKILELVLNATKQKAKTELFIRKFARIYTPIIVFLAVGICLLPSFFIHPYVFNDWLYRSLVFLVISCPCALVISIPLGYFGGIGAASKNGILFKGSNYLDVIANIKNVMMDKTGTLTKGVFKVQEVNIKSEFNKDELLQWVNAIESKSTHPVASAIRDFVGKPNSEIVLSEVEEVNGHGLKAKIKNNEILVGNFKLLEKFSVPFDVNPDDIVLTVVAIALNGQYAGYITIADEIKEDSLQAIKDLEQMGVNTVMLSGDKTSVVKYVADKIGVKNFFGDLLPEDKVSKLKEIKSANSTVAFVGDGVNDAPVIALSDAGIAMGGLGSDATIETADIVIQNDQPSKIAIAIKIGKATRKIVWQNIGFAFGVKIIVLILGAWGLATMWEAVFADVGVALLAILNAVRIQKMKF